MNQTPFLNAKNFQITTFTNFDLRLKINTKDDNLSSNCSFKAVIHKIGSQATMKYLHKTGPIF